MMPRSVAVMNMRMYPIFMVLVSRMVSHT